MKNENISHQSLRNLSVAVAVSVWLAIFALARTTAQAQTAQPPITNSISAFPIEADGAYTTPVEWTDVTPAWFISDPTNGATPTFAGDPNANSLLFAGLGRDTPSSDPELYLMYDYLARTNGPTQPNEFLGSVSFPLTVVGSNGPASTPITVEFVVPATGSGGSNAFVILVDTHDGQGFVPHAELGLEGGLGFGVTPSSIVGIASPFHTTQHELIELGVPLVIPAGFGSTPGPFPAGGQSGNGGNGYSPAPAFWGSDITDNAGDPPASGGLFAINPDGSTVIVPNPVPVGPSPITNSISAFPIEADGAYTTPVEWTDVAPAWFISDPVNGATPTFADDPNANSLLFAGLSRDTPSSDPELYLMYDYLARTNGPTQPNEFLGSVSFPLTVVGSNGPASTPITVEFVVPPTGSGGSNAFNILVDTHDGQGFVPHAELGLEGGLGFGVTPASIVGSTSPFHTTQHELIELGVPLVIPAGFGSTNGPFPAGGQKGDGGNGYSPAPAFWGSDITDNAGDPPASGGLFAINPDGSTAIVPKIVAVHRPQLTIVASGQNVILSWSADVADFTLQSTLNLGSSAVWNTVSPMPATINGQNVVTNHIPPLRQFYRLIR